MGTKVWLHAFLTLAVMEVNAQLHTPRALLPAKSARVTCWVRDRVSFKAGMDEVDRGKVSCRCQD
jgi:hypothetical protein